MPSTIEVIQALVRDLLADDAIVLGEDVSPHDVEGWDSLANVSIVYGLEDQLGIQLADGALADGFETVGDLVRIVDAALVS